MIVLNLLLQDRWVGGWLEYSLFGIVIIGIIVFLGLKISKGKSRKRRNEQLRQEDIEDRKKS